ncbi:MAG: DUF1176 domain-containing protein [Bauldia sp.]|nr:DUF1176 domain-containing protein [Bauldia sp.]
MPVLSRAALGAVILAALAAPAFAQQPPFLDDRSSGPALIRSLYNAIERQEYARAWDYFAEPPAASYEAYVAGYADTASVRITTGNASEEGAAGSVYFEVPVILEATATDGTVSVFVGCYTVRQVNPAIQDPPFRPMQITAGRLKAAGGDAAFPSNCGAGGSASAGGNADRVMAIFTASYDDDICISLSREYNPEGVTPDVYELRFNYASDEPDFGARVFHLYRVWCWRGAYNEGHIYYLEDDLGDIRQLAFAHPDVEVTYADEMNEVLDGLAVVGFTASAELSLSDFDPATGTISEFAKWRGLGDAASSGRWVFDQGAFRLDYYQVDPTFNGEIDPITIVEDGRVVFD